jgi:hypothetical protein
MWHERSHEAASRNGHEIETELKLIIAEKQYNKLFTFVSGFGNVLTADGQHLSVNDFQTKTRRYRDFDTCALVLFYKGSSLTARDRRLTYMLSAKFPAAEPNARHEYNASVPAVMGGFDALDFLHWNLNP